MEEEVKLEEQEVQQEEPAKLVEQPKKKGGILSLVTFLLEVVLLGVAIYIGIKAKNRVQDMFLWVTIIAIPVGFLGGLIGLILSAKKKRGMGIAFGILSMVGCLVPMLTLLTLDAIF